MYKLLKAGDSAWALCCFLDRNNVVIQILLRVLILSFRLIYPRTLAVERNEAIFKIKVFNAVHIPNG